MTLVFKIKGLAAIVQTNHSLRELKRGVPLCEALTYQALINEATWTMQKKLKLQVFQASEKVHFHTDAEIAVLAEACPDLQKMIFKFNPFYCSSYLNLSMFERLRHFETWGGDYETSGLAQLLEIVGANLESLHLCHVEEIGLDQLVQITQNCRNVKKLIIENCSFNLDEADLNEENLCIKNLKVPPLLELRLFKVINMPVEMLQMILKKALNIENIEIDGDVGLNDEHVLDLFIDNKLSKLKDLLIYSSKYDKILFLNFLNIFSGI